MTDLFWLLLRISGSPSYLNSDSTRGKMYRFIIIIANFIECTMLRIEGRKHHIRVELGNLNI